MKTRPCSVCGCPVAADETYFSQFICRHCNRWRVFWQNWRNRPKKKIRERIDLLEHQVKVLKIIEQGGTREDVYRYARETKKDNQSPSSS